MFSKKHILIISVFLLTIECYAKVWGGPLPLVAKPEQLKHLKIFILAGQSNMSGHGKLRLKDLNVREGIVVFGNDYKWHVGREPVDDSTNQVDQVSNDGPPGNDDCQGPGIAFAENLREIAAIDRIGLIPCSMGGSGIIQWQRNDSVTSLYGSCLNRIKRVSANGVITGVIFYQGETDALSKKGAQEMNAAEPQAKGWRRLFEEFVKSIRSDIGNKDLPVVFAQLAETTKLEFVNWNLIKQQQEWVSLRHVEMIKTSDLALEDGLHLTAESNDKLGIRFAAAMAKILKENN